MEQVKTGVGVIVLKKNKILVGERKGSHGEGMLAFPGGSFEISDSSMYACCEREVLEETGITCKAFSPDGFRDELFATFDILSDDGTKRYVTCYVVAKYISDDSGGNEYFIEPKEPNKCEGWIWLSLDELSNTIKGQQQKTWIPIEKVAYYIKAHNLM